MHASGHRCGLVLVIGSLLAVAGCYSVAYQPNPTVSPSTSAYAEANAATAAGRDAQVYLFSGISAKPAKLVSFAVAPDLASAVAVIVDADGEQFSCRQPMQFWKGFHGKAEIDSHLDAISMGAIPDNLYCMAMDSDQCHKLHAMCWTDMAEAARYADAVTALANQNSGGRQTGRLVGEMIPANNKSNTGQVAANQSANSSNSSRLTEADAAVERGDIDTAVSIYSSLSESSPDDASLHFNLALLLAQQGKYNAAVDQMNSYLVLAPHGSRVQEAQSKVLQWQAEGH